MSTGAVFFAHKKRITERNSHLVGEASGSSISNSCQAKTERRRQVAGMETGRGGTNLHASVAGSRLQRSSRLQHLGNLILRTALVLGWILEMCVGVMCTGLVWLWIGTGGELL
jgi:hypothetical protein